MHGCLLIGFYFLKGGAVADQEVLKIFELQASDVLEWLLFVGRSVVQQGWDLIDLAPQSERHVCRVNISTKLPKSWIISRTIAIDVELTQSYVAVFGKLVGPLLHSFVDTRASRAA
jgi:hypothetical protein